MSQLSQDEYNFETNSKSGISRSFINEVVTVKKKEDENIKILYLENWLLIFDGKCIDDQECQVLVLKNEQKEFKLEAPYLPKGKGYSITKVITAALDNYNLWNYVKIIVANTTDVNPG